MRSDVLGRMTDSGDDNIVLDSSIHQDLKVAGEQEVESGGYGTIYKGKLESNGKVVRS